MSSNNNEIVIFDKFLIIKKEIEFLQHFFEINLNNKYNKQINIDDKVRNTDDNNLNKKQLNKDDDNKIIKKNNDNSSQINNEKQKLNNDNKEENKNKLWSEIVQEEEEDKKNDIDETYKKEMTEIKNKIKILEQTLNNLKDHTFYTSIRKKALRFTFSDINTTWEFHENKYDDENMYDIKIKLGLNNQSQDIYQLFKYNRNTEELGIYVQNHYYWYKMSYKEKLISYLDMKKISKYVYVRYVDIDEYTRKT
jgi:hypothetical protein